MHFQTQVNAFFPCLCNFLLSLDLNRTFLFSSRYLYFSRQTLYRSMDNNTLDKWIERLSENKLLNEDELTALVTRVDFIPFFSLHLQPLSQIFDVAFVNSLCH